jgi:hypothetical protein
MMNALRPAIMLILLALLAFLVLPVRGQSGIVVNEADGIRTETVAPSAGLNTLLNGVMARVSTQYANRVRHMRLTSPPSPFQTLLASVTPRVSVEYANRTRHMRLTTPPSPLQTLLNTVSARIAFQYANRNRQLALAYPRTLLNDRTKPAISTFDRVIEGNNVRLTWVTDEFARCTLRYGTQPGNYVETVENLLYFKSHELLLTTLTQGTIYYVQLTCVDQSDNSTTSAEFVFSTDTTPPVISDAAYELTGNRVILTWRTNEPATTSVHYAQRAGSPQAVEVPGLRTEHTVTLENLADAEYEVELLSADASGNQAQGAQLAFTVDTTPPVISAIRLVGQGNQVTFEFVLNETSRYGVEYGTESGSYPLSKVVTEEDAGTLTLTVGDLAWGTEYFFRLIATDGHGNRATSAEFTYRTGQPVYLPLVRR